MGKLILDGEVVANTVSHVADDDTLPPTGTITVSLSRWLESRDELVARGDIGLRLAGGDNVADILGDLSQFALVAIEFTAFTDGRGYSYANLLRGRHGFAGELRAIGDVGTDQLQPLQRCGFNAYELREGLDAEKAKQGFDDFTVRYQPSADVDLPLYRQVNR